MNMQIGTCISKQGQIRFGTLPLIKIKGRNISIPLAIAEGKPSTKRIFISGGMHGDELNGVEVVHRFMHHLDVRKLHGSIVFFPVLNISGFQQVSRYVQYDMRDLNRSFGPGASVSHRIARKIMAVVQECDFGVDVHDSGLHNVLLPHTRVHGTTIGICKGGCTVTMGGLFGTELVLIRQGKRGMLAIEAFRQQAIPVLTVEIGGALVVWEEFIPIGLRGLYNILKYHHMYPGPLILPKKQFIIHPLELIRKHYCAIYSGVLALRCQLGDEVKRGTLLAEIHDPIHERTQLITAHAHGIVFSVKMLHFIRRGEQALSVVRLKHTHVIHNQQKGRVIGNSYLR